MIKIGLIREGKIPADSRVALTPAQCKWLRQNRHDVSITVQHSYTRCFTDAEYTSAGIEVQEDISACDILLGIKEVPANMLIDDKTYLFFSHTKKLQPYNKKCCKPLLKKILR